MLFKSLALIVGTTTALQLPGVGVESRVNVAASSPPTGRRQAIATVGSALAALATASAANAYDAIPDVKPDFEAAERARRERDAIAAKKAKVLLAKLAPLEASTNEEEFVAAADALALYVISEGSIPDGIKVKEFVKRISNALDALPRKKYACEPTRTNNGVCFTAGRGAEAAYEALIKQVRKYTIIQLGDYRRVEFQAF